MKYLLIGLIKIYQHTLSPDHSWIKARYPYGFCRFYPSCSQYTVESISKYGSFKGVFMGVKRVSRCNPFTNPKVDLP